MEDKISFDRLETFKCFLNEIILLIKELYTSKTDIEIFNRLGNKRLTHIIRTIINKNTENINSISDDADLFLRSFYDLIKENRHNMDKKNIYIYYYSCQNKEYNLYLPKIILSDLNIIDNNIESGKLKQFIKEFDNPIKIWDPICDKWVTFLLWVMFHYFRNNEIYHYGLEDETGKLIEQIGLRRNIKIHY
jgi:hypothetical protein